MSAYPAHVLACPGSMALILRAQAGELPRRHYYDAWDALADPDAYEPSEEVRIWMQENWHLLVPVQPVLARTGTAEPQTLAAIEPPMLRKPWMQPFLDEYVKNGGVIISAAEAADVNRDTVRVYRERDPEFARALQLAEEERQGVIRSTIKRRAIDGWEEPVFGRVGRDQDGIVGHQWRHDNRLLMRLAESCLPEFAKANEGTKVDVNVNANASANAQAAAAVLSAPAKLKSLQQRKNKQLAKAAQRSLPAANAKS